MFELEVGVSELILAVTMLLLFVVLFMVVAAEEDGCRGGMGDSWS